jgi:hypothetical protein
MLDGYCALNFFESHLLTVLASCAKVLLRRDEPLFTLGCSIPAREILAMAVTTISIRV